MQSLELWSKPLSQEKKIALTQDFKQHGKKQLIHNQDNKTCIFYLFKLLISMNILIKHLLKSTHIDLELRKTPFT